MIFDSQTTVGKKLEGLREQPKRWVVTGSAGFIGSHLTQTLLQYGQTVVGLDNFSTGKQENLDAIQNSLEPRLWENFSLLRGDIGDFSMCIQAIQSADVVLHQAAFVSVPASLENPQGTHITNVTGFLNILKSCVQSGIQRLVYASTSALYGDPKENPRNESEDPFPLSPYATTKQMNELCAQLFHAGYSQQSIGLRYFNVFGKRQDPNGAYAAVVPKWVYNLTHNEPVTIFGDGKTTRDFCYIANIVQANILAATTDNLTAVNQYYNIGIGRSITLNELYYTIREKVSKMNPSIENLEPIYKDFRPGDVRHSKANIQKAEKFLGYQPTYDLATGLEDMLYA